MKRIFDPPEISEKESFGEQMNDLGVTVIKKNAGAVTGVKWARSKIYGKPAITVGKKTLYFNVLAVEMLNPRGKRYEFGVGDYQGKRVILLREGERGYKLTFSKTKNRGSRYAVAHSSGLFNQLTDAGIKPGRYIISKVKGGWMGVPE